MRWTAAALTLLYALQGRAFALTVDVKEVRASAATVHATVQLRDVIPDRFKKVVERGGQLHLRVQAELWERRPVWDRLVYPAIARMFRLWHQPPSRDLTVDEPSGVSTVFSALPNPWEVLLELGARDRIDATQRYYLHIVATIGTLADRDAEQVNDAVFGRGDDNSLGSLGRMLFRTALKMSDYLQSVSADAKSRTLDGAAIIRP